MYINRPIKNVVLENDSLTINDNKFLYESFKEDDIEILESLVNKRAYASTLLFLNKNYTLKSINEQEVNKNTYMSYLRECHELLEKGIRTINNIESFKPLTSVNTLEILESDSSIVRGKNDKFLVEEFKDDEAYNIVELFKDSDKSKETYMDALNKISELEYNNNIDKDLYDELIKELNDTYATSKKEIVEEAEGTQVADIPAKEDYIDIHEEVELKDNLYIITDGDYADTYEIDGITELPMFMGEFTSGDLEQEEFRNQPILDGYEGPILDGIKDGQCIFKYNKKEMKESYDYNVPFNHGFKGFTLTESGRYERGNFVLIRENDTVKAIRK